MSEIVEYVKKYEVGESGKEELIRILNKSLLEISRGILETRESKVEIKINKSESQRYKSKKAEEYALEHGIRMEEFEMLEISKKDVEEKVRERTKREESVPKSKNESKKKEENKEIVKRERVICSGINKKGEGCKSVGTICPEGAKKKYCFRHAEDYRSFECDSDSSDEEELKEEYKSEEKSEELKEESYD
jgi:hypothetical protein